MSVDISDDVAQAVKTLWMATAGLGTQDATGFSAGELKATLPSPEPDTYAHIKVEEGREKEYSTSGATRPAGETPYKDYKLVTLTVRGQYKNASKAAAVMRSTFGLNLLPTDYAALLAAQNLPAPTLTMPSGARFIAARPKPFQRDPEPQPKNANEIWKAWLQIEVETVRTEG